MRLLTLLLFFALTLFPAQAQTATVDPATQSSAEIDQLITILENDESRAALIDRLRNAQDAPAAEAPVAAQPEADLSIARQLAEYTRAAAEGFSATIDSLGSIVTQLGAGFDGALSADFAAFQAVAIGLVIVAIGLFGSFWLLRLLMFVVQRRLAARAEGKGWFARLFNSVLAILVDAASVLIAWAVGYGVALSFSGGTTPSGEMGINQSLLLNAFLLVELTKLASRIVLQPRFASLRLLPVEDGNAAYWSFWLSRVISLLGYTFLFLSPLLAGNVAVSAANALEILVMATAVIIGITIVLQNKNDVRQWLVHLSSKRGDDGAGQLLTLLGQIWHIVAIGYLLALLVVWFTNPDQALPFMLGATAQSIIAIVVGIVVVSFIRRFVGAGLHLPADVRQRLPLLEARLHAFVPRVMQVVRWVVIVGVLLAIAQAWHLFDFVGWIGSEGGQQVAGSIISAALIIAVCIVLHVVVASWVEYRLNTTTGKLPTAREKTLLGLFKNAFTVALVVFGLMLALAQIGVNIAPLLAGAGVVGLAIGFGAQKLVQDIITGIFIQFENVMNEGDSVEAAGKSGVVEKLTIRSVTIRDMTGTVHLIPFSSVDQVSNMVRGFSFYVAEFDVAYDSDIDAVKQIMREAFEVVMQSEHKDVVLDALDPPILVSLSLGQMKMRSRIKTLAGKQWGPGRLYSETVKRMFAERGIQTPTTTINYRTVEGAARLMPPSGEVPTQS